MTSSLLVAALLAAASLSGSGNAAAPARMSQADRQFGAQSHSEILREYGHAMSGPAADMLTRVGRRVAVQSGLSVTGEDFKVTLLDSAEVNAFATLGGYIYATRGLLAIMNDEAELGAVLGHEVGHVAKRHVRGRQQRQTMSRIFAVTMMVVGGVPVGNLTGRELHKLNLGFSRGDEFAADDLGVRYAAGAGYDPAAAADALDAMRRYESDMDGFTLNTPGESAPKGDHPDTAERVARARQEAVKTGRAGQGERERAAYLAAIDGLPFGGMPEHGLLDGREFKLPMNRIAFTIPSGVTVSTSERGVTLVAPGSQAMFSEQWLDAPFAGAVDEIFGRIGPVDRLAVQSATINGLDVRYAAGRGETDHGPIDIDVIVYRVPDQRRIYSIVTQAPQGAGLGPFREMVESVRPIPAGEAIDQRPVRLRTISVRSGDTIDSMVQRMAISDGALAQFLLLNNLKAGDVLVPGSVVKLLQR